MTKNNDGGGLDDFDDDYDDWPAAGQNSNATKAAQPVNPALRQQQFNAIRPQTSGKPGMRGFHGIGKNPKMAATGADDDLDDMLDGFGGGADPLMVINKNK